MTDLHVVHVFAAFGPGGSEIRTATVLNGLPPRYRHTIVSLNPALTVCAERLRPEVRREIVTPRRPARGFLAGLSMARRIRAMRPDVVVSYNWATTDVGIWLWLLRVRPHVHVLDGFQHDEALRPVPRRERIRRLIYPRLDALVAVSSGLRRAAVERWTVPAARVAQIPNGIDLERFSPGDAATTRASLGAEPGDLVVGCVAHFRAEKNPDRLLRAFVRVAPDFPRARLVLVGGSPTPDDAPRRRLEEMARVAGLAGRFRIAGYSPRPEEYYRSFDLFALSSDTEQMPLSVIEAMACAKPVLATDVGDIRTMVSGENAEYVVPPTDETAYAARMAALLSDAELRARLGRANRARAEAAFSDRDMVAAYDALFRRLAERPRREPSAPEAVTGRV